MKVYYGSGNVGDTLAGVIISNFNAKPVERASASDTGKVVAVGSFLDIVENGDTLLGVGSNKPDFLLKGKKDLRVLSVRGPLTARQIVDYEVPEIYGDPAILLPLTYAKPLVERHTTQKVGIIPHYADWSLFSNQEHIKIDLPWYELIDIICSCEYIETSSLHALIIAHVYDVPVRWQVYSDNVAGGEFKFQDYFYGVGLGKQKPGSFVDPFPAGDRTILSSQLLNLIGEL